MSEPSWLDDAALGDLAAILPGVALADATKGNIRPDPDAKPIPRHEQFEHPLPEPRTQPWTPEAIGVVVRGPNDGLEGAKYVGGAIRRISPGVIRLSASGLMALQVHFFVDNEAMPRLPPFQPPQVGVQWFYTTDEGVRSETAVRWDPAPVYGGAGKPLTANFGDIFGFPLPGSGWLTWSARIDDPQGAAEFDDTIRVLIAS